MEYKQIYDKYRSRLIYEGILKSLLLGLIVGCGVCGITALITWFTDFNGGFWLSLGLLVAGVAASTPAFYFAMFKPDEQSVARRMDREGLEERVVTMRELQDDKSYIAERQRFDAAKNVSAAGVREDFLKCKVSKKVIIAASIVGAFGLAFAVVAGLYDYGVIDGGRKVFADVFPDVIPSFNINYGVSGSATLTEGDIKQTVKRGEATDEVLYTADRYYYFTQWRDKFGNIYFDGPSRHETNVNEDNDLTAYFAELAALEKDRDLSRELGSSGSGNGNGNGNYGDGSHSDQYDQIINGQIDYAERYEIYYKAAMQYLTDHPELSAEERAMIEAYFEFLKTDGKNE